MQHLAIIIGFMSVVKTKAMFMFQKYNLRKQFFPPHWCIYNQLGFTFIILLEVYWKIRFAEEPKVP